MNLNKFAFNAYSFTKRAVYILIVVVLFGCSSIPLKSDSKWIGYTESGEASYYAMKYQFRETASGELFNQFSNTAAHKELPFGTKVQVTNVKNKKSVVVKINDRGPFSEGKIIDLSRSAFKQIGDLDLGIIYVNIEVVK
ncbi:MAG: septal ring lytic transglycosylase RlpA family protein [Desulfobacterales bacterium]|nr:septal ring lytic transglycosylase RlpA family protein [Desulfobacterales bacterium]